MKFSMRSILMAVVMLTPAWLRAQDEVDLKPVTRTYAITNVNIIQGPGRKIEMGTILLKDGLIVNAGKGIAIPSDAVVIKADSMYAYAGFIDGLTRAGVTKPKEEQREKVKDPGNPTPERAGITPQTDVRAFLNPADKGLEELRNLGFTTVQVVPYGNFLPGQSAIVNTAGSSGDAMVLINKASLYSEFTPAQGVYPATVLGVMSKYRDLYRQAAQAKSYEALYASNRNGLERPANDKILEAFYPVIDQRVPVLFRTEKLLDANRAMTLKNDLGFSLVLADLKDGWPLINKIKSSGARVFLSLDLPEELKKDSKKDAKDSKASTPAQVEKEALDKRKAEAIANYTAQAAAFQKAGVPFGFTSMSAKSKDIQANLRRMIAAGLPEDAALAALTTTPAQMLGLSDRMGTIDNGKMANLVISDKPYFNEKAKVRYVFVDGVAYKMEVKETKKSDPNAKVEIEGSWSTVTQGPQGNSDGKVVFKKDGSGYSGTVSGGRLTSPVDLQSVSLDGNSLTYSYTVTFGSNSVKIDVEVSVEGDSFKGTTTAGRFGSSSIEGTRDPKK
ncbi:MAG: amidohydrolase family protein [Bacteroidetes bacterium]|nr:amidohydrolase family protein [Bacteroidota bacterium]